MHQKNLHGHVQYYPDLEFRLTFYIFAKLLIEDNKYNIFFEKNVDQLMWRQSLFTNSLSVYNPVVDCFDSHCINMISQEYAVLFNSVIKILNNVCFF